MLTIHARNIGDKTARININYGSERYVSVDIKDAVVTPLLSWEENEIYQHVFRVSTIDLASETFATVDITYDIDVADFLTELRNKGFAYQLLDVNWQTEDEGFWLIQHS